MPILDIVTEMPVQVALRIRPPSSNSLDLSQRCIKVNPGEPQILLDDKKMYTFDYVFDVDSFQSDVYTTGVEHLVEEAMKGINVTVIACGQSGSGKSFTMGTGFNHEKESALEGIIPRAVLHIFSSIQSQQQQMYGGGPDGDVQGHKRGNHYKKKPNLRFHVAAQFVELHNEKLIDLLDPFFKTNNLRIQENEHGEMCVIGASAIPIKEPGDAMRCLQQGAIFRSTVTNQSNTSCSHAVFTLFIRRERVMFESGNEIGVMETITSKIHFVDLAASCVEPHTGDSGLTSFVNVITTLVSQTKKTPITYNDSKLTRMLKDSLGGNCQTLLIACISSRECDLIETIHTISYTHRARNIRNQVHINQDQSSKMISSLSRGIAVLQSELWEYKHGIRLAQTTLKKVSKKETNKKQSALLSDNRRMQQRAKAMQATIDALTARNDHLTKQRIFFEKRLKSNDPEMDMMSGYVLEIERLQARLIEMDQMYTNLTKSKNIVPEVKIRNVNLNTTLYNDKTDTSFKTQSLPCLINSNSNSISDISIWTSWSNNDLDVSFMKDRLDDAVGKLMLDKRFEQSQYRDLCLNSKPVQTIDNDILRKHEDVRSPKIANEYMVKASMEYDHIFCEMRHKLNVAEFKQAQSTIEHKALETQIELLKNELLEVKSSKLKEAKDAAKQDLAPRNEAKNYQGTMKTLQSQTLKNQVHNRKQNKVKKTYTFTNAASRIASSKTGKVIKTKKYYEEMHQHNSECSNRAVVEMEAQLRRLSYERQTVKQDLSTVMRTLNCSERYELDYSPCKQRSIPEKRGFTDCVSDTQLLHNIVDDVYNIDDAKVLLKMMSKAVVLHLDDLIQFQDYLHDCENLITKMRDTSAQQFTPLNIPITPSLGSIKTAYKSFAPSNLHKSKSLYELTSIISDADQEFLTPLSHGSWDSYSMSCSNINLGVRDKTIRSFQI